jgi:ketosteroid isomerase-like protein
MMKFLMAIAVFLGLFGAQPALATDADDIRAANARWTVAMTAKDLAVIEQIVAPRFALTWGAASASETIPRAAWLANFEKMTISEYRVDIVDLKIDGDRAVATVEGSWKVTSPRGTRNEPFKLRDTWERSESGWQVTGRHMSE